MDAQTLRSKTFADLAALSFRPATSLPLPDMAQRIRPELEIASRLLALDALFTWVAFSEADAPTSRLEKYIERNQLPDWLTQEEATTLAKPRAEAHLSHVDNIGWKLENMWALAWVLGFSPEPGLEAELIHQRVVQSMLFDFLPGLDATVEMLLERNTPRSPEAVISMEYRFYCAHNAVRSAQLGHSTVPSGFHPVLHGGAIHERRHSFTWTLSPEETWDGTDLST